MKENEVKELNENLVIKESEYCSCERDAGIYSNTDIDEFGYWDMCSKCNKKIEDGFHYYNHFDGQDHDDCCE